MRCLMVNGLSGARRAPAGTSDRSGKLREGNKYRREYSECVARTALNFEEGWFVQKEGTVIVRLYDHSETELQVEM